MGCWLAWESRVPTLFIVQVIHWLILDMVNFRGELTATELGADPATGLELGSLPYQAALVIEDERITAGQDRLGRERPKATVQLLPMGPPTQQDGLTRPAQSHPQSVEFVPSPHQPPHD